MMLSNTENLGEKNTYLKDEKSIKPKTNKTKGKNLYEVSE